MLPYWSAMLDTSTFGMMNMQWNLGLQTMLCNQSFFMSNPFMPSFDFLCNPGMALWQTNQRWSQQQNNPWGGGSIWNAQGGWNPSATWNQSPWSPWAQFGPSNPANNNPGSNKTATEKKIDKLKEIFESLKKIEAVSDETIDAYNNALKEKTSEDKLDALKEIFEDLSADDIVKGILSKDEYKKQLSKIGYNLDKEIGDSASKKEYKDIQKILTDVKSSITSKDYTYVNSFSSLIQQGNSDYNIMQLLSVWNDENKKDDNRSIIRMIANNLPEEENFPRDNFKIIIDNFEKVLSREAVDADVDNSKIEALQKAKSEVLEKLKTDKPDEKVTVSDIKTKLLAFADAFEDVYMQTRINQAQELNETICDKYADLINDIQENVISDDIIVYETQQDLKSEGFEEKNIPVASSDDGANDDGITPTGGSSEGNEGTAETKANIQKLVEGGVLNAKDENGIYYSPKYNRYYKVGNDGLIHRYDKNTQKCTEVANVSAMLQKVESPAYLNGKKVVELIDTPNTNSDDYDEINEFLSKIDKDSVMDFLKGVYEKKGEKPTEGIIEHLDDEWDGGAITMDNKKRLINSFLEAAKAKGLENDSDYKKIEKIMKKYSENGRFADKPTFNHDNHRRLFSWGNAGYVGGGAVAGGLGVAALVSNPGGWFIAGGAAICGAIGYFVDQNTDNEVIDECMQRLYQKMK